MNGLGKVGGLGGFRGGGALPLPAPLAPTITNTTGTTVANATWTDVAGFADGVDHYRVEVKKSAASSWTAVATVSSNASAVDLGVCIPGGNWNVRVVAIHSGRESSGASATFTPAWGDGPTSPILATDTPDHIVIGTDTITLSWTSANPAFTTSDTAYGRYEVEVTKPDTSTTTYTVALNSASKDLDFVATLTQRGVYSIRVRAAGANSDATSWSGAVTCTAGQWIEATPQVGYAGSNSGGSGWNSANNAQGAPDGSYASVTLVSSTSSQLFLTTYGFSFPAESRNFRYKVDITRKADVALAVSQAEVGIAFSGGRYGNSKGGDFLASSDETVTYGDNTDVWGNPGLTPAQHGDTSFGVEIALAGTGVGSVDAVRLTVYSETFVTS